MEMWFRNSFFMLLFSPFTSACSLDMIAGAEDEQYPVSNATLYIVPAFRIYRRPDVDPKLAELFAIKNQTALRELHNDILQLNRSKPSIKHTLVTESDNTNFEYTDYINNWKISIELYGNKHYSKNLNYQTPNGNALVDVAITKSGRLHSYKILLSAGSPNLNAAINDIIHKTAPFFIPLSLTMQKNTDVLHIAQMWQFRN